MKTAKVFAAILFGVSVLLTSCQKEPEPISVTGISLDSSSLTLTEGETARLTATISPSNADNQGVIWSSSNASVASVSNGTITAISAGSATITAKSDDGGKTATCNVTVNSKIVAVTGVSLDKTSMELTEGDEYTLVATVLPENASNKSVSWKSEDETIATVSDGKVKAIKPGNASISVKTEDGGKTASCEITVIERIYPVESVSLDKTSLELTEGDEATLTATIKPDNASNKQVSWKSEDETIATVSDGKVKAIKPGSTTITVTTSDGNKTASCSIKVNEKIYHVESVTLDKTSLELTEGDEATLTATVLPENANNKNILWSSSNENVATVSNGLVKAVAPGTTSIIAKSEDGEKTATCNVTVMEKETIIQFADIVAKYACVEKYDTNGDGEISTKEAAAVKSLDGLFTNWNTVTSFDEIVYFKNVHSINGLFKNCKNLECITIPENISILGNNTFYGCSSLTHVNLLSNITSLGSYAFYNCTNLIEIDIPSDIKTIPSHCFYNCKSLKSISIPYGVTSIDSYAFYGCRQWAIDVPETVSYIGSYCFAYTPNVIVRSSSAVPAASSAFSKVNAIYVPQDLLEKYKLMSIWSDVASLLHPISAYKDKEQYTLVTRGMVDMGGSVKWAACNLGANSPEESGNYYAWGEVEPKREYTWSSYKWSKGSTDTITKYCTNSSFGTVDNKSILDQDDDAAYVQSGGRMRIPAYSEAMELVSGCFWEYTTYNDTKGNFVYGLGTGNIIFVPEPGYYYGFELKYVGEYGLYWINSSSTKEAKTIDTYYGNDPNVYSKVRHAGLPIRPVCE